MNPEAIAHDPELWEEYRKAVLLAQPYRAQVQGNREVAELVLAYAASEQDCFKCLEFLNRPVGALCKEG